MMERIEGGVRRSGRGIRGLRVTRNSVTEPTSGTIRSQDLGHYRPLEKAGWLGRSTQLFLNAAAKGRGSTQGHSHGRRTVEPMEQVSWHEWAGGGGGGGGEPE